MRSQAWWNTSAPSRGLYATAIALRALPRHLRQCAFARPALSVCAAAQMIGKLAMAYAEFIVVPERSVFRLTEEIHSSGAILMCSSALRCMLEQGSAPAR